MQFRKILPIVACKGDGKNVKPETGRLTSEKATVHQSKLEMVSSWTKEVEVWRGNSDWVRDILQKQNSQVPQMMKDIKEMHEERLKVSGCVYYTLNVPSFKNYLTDLNYFSMPTCHNFMHMDDSWKTY